MTEKGLPSRLRQAAEDRIRAEAELKDAVYDALDAGLTITDISKFSGLTRQTIYDWKSKKP